MLVSELMVREPQKCGPNEPMSTAARIMWEHDCGSVPVVDRDGRPVGIITDRDICMASYIQGRALGHLRVADSMAREIFTCQPDDGVDAAIRIMAEGQVHRLPVVDEQGILVGILSLADIARALEPTNGERLAAEQVAGLVAALSRVRVKETVRESSRPRRRGAVSARRADRSAAGERGA